MKQKVGNNKMKNSVQKILLMQKKNSAKVDQEEREAGSIGGAGVNSPNYFDHWPQNPYLKLAYLILLNVTATID